jgi:phosphoribosylanthranilate isomerase
LVRVKICGLMEVEHAIKAGKAGVDFIGMVFAESKRQVTPERAAQLVKSVRDINPRPEAVGVFRNAPAEEVNRIARECGLDRVQLAGQETPEFCRNITFPIIKVVHVSSNAKADSILAQVQKWYEIMQGQKFFCLLDTVVDGRYGGTGVTFDWNIAKIVAARFPIMVAGGLTPENVAELVREVKPWGVDVASGVETNGRKDPAKIEAFIRAVWNAE